MYGLCKFCHKLVNLKILALNIKSQEQFNEPNRSFKTLCSVYALLSLISYLLLFFFFVR